MRTPTPNTLAVPVPVPLWRKVSRQVADAIWARRWKIAVIVALSAVNRLCDLLPTAAEPFCDLLAKVGAVFGGGE